MQQFLSQKFMNRTKSPVRILIKQWLLTCVLLWGMNADGLAVACPFCSATSQTLSEELASAEVAVIARLKEPADALAANNLDSFDPSDPNTGMATFSVIDVIRGGERHPGLDEIKVVYFGEGETEKVFLIHGIDAGLPTASGPGFDWTTPLPLSSRGVEYIKQIGSLPEKGSERLEFFMGFFEDEDPLLAQDAYDEFARAPYSEIIALAERMDRGRLMQWIVDPQVGPTHRRLYLTMLGVCGKPSDADKLEAMLEYNYEQIEPALSSMVAVMGLQGSAMGAPLVQDIAKADVRRRQQCLDALIAAYLKLKGPEGLPLIERRFLANPNAEYTHVYSTIMALRFHGEETDVLPREKLLAAMRMLLDNEEISDQVIPDLARWEDWSILDRLVSMFKESSEDAWIRQPVISYLLTAAEQPAEVGRKANAAIAELESLDPESVKRARSYMAFGMLARGSASDATDPNAPAADDSPAVVQTPKDAQSAESSNTEGEPAAEDSLPPTPSKFMLISAPLLAGLLLMCIFALLLRGADVRSHGDRS